MQQGPFFKSPASFHSSLLKWEAVQKDAGHYLALENVPKAFKWRSTEEQCESQQGHDDTGRVLTPQSVAQVGSRSSICSQSSAEHYVVHVQAAPRDTAITCHTLGCTDRQ